MKRSTACALTIALLVVVVGGLWWWRSGSFALPLPQAVQKEAGSGGCPINSTTQCQADGVHSVVVPSPSAIAPSSVSTSSYNFSLEKLGGGTISLAQYRGQKPVVVDFWASWCPNCRRDMPQINQWYRQYQDQVEVIGVNLQESPQTVQQFVDSNGIVFPIVLDPTGSVATSFGIQFTNTHFLFNKSGELVRIIPGDIKEADVVSLIKS